MASQQGFFFDEQEIVGKKNVAKPPRSTSKKGSSKKQAKIYDCETCGLSKSCRSPKITRFGKGGRSIMFVGLCPGRTEDKDGTPFVGASGDFLMRQCDRNGIDLYNDCWRTNIVECYPGKDKNGRDKKPTDTQIKCCAANIQREIEECHPQLIICLGTEAAQAVLKTSAISSPNVTHLHGKVFPYHALNCWVGVCHHPSYFLRRKNNDDGVYDELIFTYDLANILGVYGLPLPKKFTNEGNRYITSADEAVVILKRFSESKDVTAFDYETNDKTPFIKEPRIINVSLSSDKSEGFYIPIQAKDPITGKFFWSDSDLAKVTQALKDFVTSDCPKTIQNYQMEELWSRVVLGVSIKNFVYDTMLSYHVINNRTGNNNLAFQSFEFNGQEYKSEINIEKLEEEPIEKQVEYSCTDSRETIAAYHDQQRQLANLPKLKDFNDLFAKSLPVLVNMKQRGIRISEEALNDIEKEFTAKIEERLNIIRQNKNVQRFEKENGTTFNANSPKQWNVVLYRYYGLPPILTENQNESTSAEAIEEILETTDNQEVKELLSHYARYKKYVDVIKKVASAPSEMSKQVGLFRRMRHPDGKIHPNTNLHTVPTYRSSVTDPPSQNMYKHDEECRSCRRMVVPSPGNILLEGDYKAHEARNIGMASQDVELIRQTVAKIDIHKKWAGKLWNVPIDLVNADQKYGSKNGFVFPSIYGSKPKSISKHLGLDLDLIIALQDELWSEFAGVREWQRNLIKFYNENGYVEGLTGYRCYGPLTAYQIFNYPIQGCIEGTQKILTKEDGYGPIKDRVGSKYVWNGEQFVEAEIVYSGLKQKQIVHLKNGQKIITSPNHKFMTISAVTGNHRWKRASEFAKVERILISDAVENWDCGIKLPDIPSVSETTHRKCTDYSFEQISNGFDRGVIFGRLASDGHVSKSRPYINWIVAEHEKEVLPVLTDIFDRAGWKYTLEKKSRKKENRKPVYYIHIWSKKLADQCRKLRLKEHIDQYFFSSREMLRGYLRGYIDGDGGVTVSKNKKYSNTPTPISIAFGKKHKTTVLPEDIQSALLLFGIQSRLNRYDKLTRIWIRRRHNKMYSEQVGFINPLKMSKITFGGKLLKQKYATEIVKSVELINEQIEMYDVVDCPKQQFMCNGYVVHNTAFHFLLAAMIEVDDVLVKNGFKTQLVNEIHDAMVFDADPAEADDVIKIATEAMIKQRWPWQNVPLDVSWEKGVNWWKMEEVTTTESKDSGKMPGIAEWNG